MKYNIIYADPPWVFQAWSSKGNDRSAEKHYPTMTIEEIKALPVREITAKDAILFLWATFPTLDKAFQVINAWGFVYKTVAFVWVKQNKTIPTLFWGMGYWTRSNAEICLLATKGNIKRQASNVHQVIMQPVETHSKKPGIIREKIVALIGDLPRIELFAREKIPGWHSWGNEVVGNIELMDGSFMEVNT